MRIKLRFSNGAPAAILTLEPSTSVSTFLREIKSKGNISLDKDVEIRYGFPPKVLDLSGEQEGTSLDGMGVKLDGEQLVVNVVDSGDGSRPSLGGVGSVASRDLADQSTLAARIESSDKLQNVTTTTTTSSTTSESRNPSLSHLNKKTSRKDKEPPTVSLGQRGTVVLRVMEDDNSCLFNAVSYVTSSSQFSSHELRHFVATTIQSDLVEYNAGILGEDPDKYCEWITMDTSWGGGIELKILANFFDYEIISMDVGTGKVYPFNEGEGKKRCIVVYSGIHYDALALSPPSSYYPGITSNEPDRDITIFDGDDDEIVEAGKELLRKLRERHYHTDTQNFTLRCNVCKVGLKGQKQAIEHATRTGHTAFGEYE